MDKEVGITSFQLISRLRRALGVRRAGHCGTLDPFATGALPAAFGRYTTALHFMEGYDKVYAFTARLGAATDTYDHEGKIMMSIPEQSLADLYASGELHRRVQTLTPRFSGVQIQTPPMYSAIKVDGKPLYQYARSGQEIERKSREIRIAIQSLTLKAEEGRVLLEGVLEVSKGSYIRSWVHDFGEALGTYAHCIQLRRLRCGPFSADQGIRSGDLLSLYDELGKDPGLVFDALVKENKILPLEAAWPEIPTVDTTEKEALDIICGRRILWDSGWEERLKPATDSERAGRVFLRFHGKALAMAFLTEEEGARTLKTERVWMQRDDLF